MSVMEQLRRMASDGRGRVFRNGDVELTWPVMSGLPFGARVVVAENRGPRHLFVWYRIGSSVRSVAGHRGSRSEAQVLLLPEHCTVVSLWQHIEDRLTAMSAQWVEELGGDAWAQQELC